MKLPLKRRIQSLLVITLIIGTFLPGYTQQSAQDLYDKGEFLLINARYGEAQVMFEKAAELDKENHKIPYQIATCHIGMGNFKEAVKSFERAVEIKKDYYEAYERLGDLYSQQFRIPDKAIENYELAFKFDENIENKLRYKLEVIAILYTFNKYPLALSHIKDAEALIPDSFDLQFLEVKYYNETEQYQKAVDLMEQLIVEVPEKPGNEMYFYELGRSYHYLGQYNKANEYFQKADNGEYRIKIQRFRPDYYFSIADTYFRVYEFEKAEEHLKTMMEMGEPTTTGPIDLQKRIALVKEDKSKLIEAEKSAIEKEKDEQALADRYRELANYANQAGDFVQAELAVEEYLNIRPRDYGIMFLKAMILNKLQRHKESMEFLNRILKNPKLPAPIKAQFSFGLGLAAKAGGELDQAEEAFKHAYSGPFKNAAGNELMEIYKIRQYQDVVTEE